MNCRHALNTHAILVLVSTQVLTRQLMALVEMQNNPRKFSRQAQLFQRDRFLGLKVRSIALLDMAT